MVVNIQILQIDLGNTRLPVFHSQALFPRRRQSSHGQLLSFGVLFPRHTFYPLLPCFCTSVWGCSSPLYTNSFLIILSPILFFGSIPFTACLTMYIGLSLRILSA